MKKNQPPRTVANFRSPVVLSASEHPIRNDMLPAEAIWILNRLHWHGYQAYLVGGGVRDLLLGLSPKDFDLTTNAPPHVLEKLFHNCRVVGRRFRIVHVYFREGHVFEVSTFRAFSPTATQRHSPKREDNSYGTAQEDAWRRDITINGLFYDSKTQRVIDYVGGLEDLKNRLIRTIGPAKQRFHEDPVRMIRAIRHAARHHFHMESETWSAIQQHARDMRLCSTARVLEEFLRELRGGYSHDSFLMMKESQLLRGWLPGLDRWLEQSPTPSSGFHHNFGPYVNPSWYTRQAFWQRLQTHDTHIQEGHELSDLVLVASFCLPLCWNYIFQQQQPGQRYRQLWQQAVFQGLHSILKELTLSAFHWQELTQLYQTYWRLHLVPQQPDIVHGLKRSEWLFDAIELFVLDLESHNVAVPDWLFDLIPVFSPLSSFPPPTESWIQPTETAHSLMNEKG